MTALTHGIKRKLSLLQLADKLGNGARACRIIEVRAPHVVRRSE